MQGRDPTASADWRVHYFKGYAEALADYGIWKDGVQYIGCRQIPIKQAMQEKLDELFEGSGYTVKIIEKILNEQI